MSKRNRLSVEERKAAYVEREGIEQAKMWLARNEEWSPDVALTVLASTQARIETVLAKPEPPFMERTVADEVATWFADVNFDHPPPPLSLSGPEQH